MRTGLRKYGNSDQEDFTEVEKMTIEVPLEGNCFFFFLRFYLFIHRDRERGRDTGRGRSRHHTESLRGTQSRVSRITPWAAGGAKPLCHRGCPLTEI